jgi:LCP family protein required for cell wall assembly
MVSIPRDTRIEIEGQGFQKFNAAYTFGGPSGTISAVKQLTDVDIDHYAEINFEGLVGLVDAIGGIDVVVDEEIDDEDAGGHIDAGEQHLDGEHALILARSRAYVDGDYSRQANQRKVIMAIINKALTAPASELSGIIKASTKFLKTDKGIDVDFIYDLADQIRHNNDYPVEIFTASIPSSTATIDEVSWVIADTAGVKAMMKLFTAGEDVSQGVSESSIAEDIAAARGTSVDDENLYDEGAIGVSYYEGDDYATSPELYEEGYTEGAGVNEYGTEGDYEGDYEGEGEYVEETESGDYSEDEGQ